MKQTNRPIFDEKAIGRIGRLAAAQKKGNFNEQFAKEFPTADTPAPTEDPSTHPLGLKILRWKGR